MSRNFERSLAECLRSDGLVAIPGIGSLIMQKIATPFSLGQKRIQPERKVVLYSNVNHQDKTVSSLSKKLNKSREKVEKRLVSYGQSLLNSIVNLGSVDFLGLGRLSRSESKDIVFETELDNFQFDTFLLPDVHLEPIVRSTEEKLHLLQSKEPTITAVQKSESEASKPKFSYIENTYDDDDSGCLWWIIGAILIGLLLAFLLLRSCDPVMSYFDDNRDTTDTTLAGIDSTMEHVENSVEMDSFAMKVSSNPVLAPYKDILTEQNLEIGCIIITGSYKKQTNVVKMRDKIIRNGYSPYTEYHGEYTRVGLIFPCDEEDLVSRLDKVRARISTKAWYLSPDMDAFLEERVGE